MFFDGLNLTPRKEKTKLDLRSFEGAYVPPPAKPVDWYSSAAELEAARGTAHAFDVESYHNYFVVSFKSIDSGKVIAFELSDYHSFSEELLLWVVTNFMLIGFNSNHYDLAIMCAAGRGMKPGMLKHLTALIIEGNVRVKQICEDYNVNIPAMNHIDLIEVAPLSESLKTYSGRLHCERMQDLPFHHDRTLTFDEMKVVKLYNINDLDNTILLLKELEPILTLRQQMSKKYNVDLRSMSDAQLAEAVILKELRKITRGKLSKPAVDFNEAIYYQVPDFVSFKTPELQRVLELIRTTGFELDGAGRPKMPEALAKLALRIGKTDYKLGMGGLHSQEKRVSYVADALTMIIDRDVTSYYPRIILNQRLYPKHLGEAFLTVYNSIVERRLEGKRLKLVVEADGLKIVINGSFGKLGSPYSMLFAPDLMLQTTITGQLGLLMEIEMLEDAGFEVVSANTDGVVTKVPRERYTEFLAVIKEWERITCFETEETRYASIWSRDVNNYIAITEEGKCKAKGVYSERGSAQNSRLSKNPEHLICSLAVQAYLKDGTPIEQTVTECQDFTKFLCVSKVQGGAVKNGEYLGKVIRWYYAKDSGGHIQRASNSNKVAKTDLAKPCMDLPSSMPDDISYEWYVAKAQEMLGEVGFFNKNNSIMLV